MGRTGSMKISKVPPQTRPVSYLGFWLRSKVRVRGFSSAMTSRAACQTSASTQPPPMVPAMEPSSRTSILALWNEGMEPRAFTMVATAPRRPSRCNFTISSYIFIHFDYSIGRNRSQTVEQLIPASF